jgi:hypothetical protein
MKIQNLKTKIMAFALFVAAGLILLGLGYFLNDLYIAEWGIALIIISPSSFAEEIAGLIKKFLTS